MYRKILPILMVLAGVLILAACQAGEPQQPDPDWLITRDDLTGFSGDIGIVQWELDQELPGQYRICRMFEGASWSVNPNFSMNCVNRVTPGSTFTDVIESMYNAQVLYPTDIALEPVFVYDRDFALYAHMADNGHSVYDAFLLGDGLLFRASVSVGTPGGHSPETLFAEHGPVIETFLWNMLKTNLERSHHESLAYQQE